MPHVKIKYYLYITAMPLIIGCLIFFTACLNDSTRRIPPKAVKGVLDLTDWDLKKDGPIDLKGEYEFYWSRHLSPSDFSKVPQPEKTGFIKVPGYWKGYEIEGVKYSGDGYATYRLSIILNKQKESLALRVLEISNAYTLYINGRKAASLGVAGKNRETTVPRQLYQIVDFESDTNREEIILQVSSFRHRRGGGPWEAIKLGTEKEIREISRKRLSFDLFLFGSIFIMALYHLGLFLFRKKNLSPLYFSIFCFLIVSRHLSTGDRYLAHYFPQIDWEWLIKIEYLSFYLAVPAFALFMRSLFPGFSKRFLFLLEILAIIFSGIVIFAPARLYTYMINPYEVITIIAMAYSIYVVVVSLLHKNIEALVFLIGFVILCLTTINDMLHVDGIIQTGFYAPFSLFAFILSQAFLLSFRFSTAMTAVESQRKELRDTLGSYKTEIIERKRAEERAKLHQEQLMQASKMVALGTLVSGVAHEINNPNNFIMLNSPILLEAWESAMPILDEYYKENGDFIIGGMKYTKIRENLPKLFSGILDGSKRIKQIVEDLRNFVRDESPDLTQSVDINAVLKSAISLLSNMIKKSKSHFSIEYGNNLPPIKGNFQRLEQVVINLIQNSCQALMDNKNGIFVSTSCDEKMQNIMIKIQDKGKGIPPENLQHIMDPFFTTKHDSGGIGLGLSISSKIIKEHGGKMNFISKPGKGTEIEIILPVTESENTLTGRT